MSSSGICSPRAYEQQNVYDYLFISNTVYSSSSSSYYYYYLLRIVLIARLLITFGEILRAQNHILVGVV